MAFVCHYSVPFQTCILPSSSCNSFTSSLPFKVSYHNHRLTRLHISSSRSTSYTTTDNHTISAAANSVPTTEDFDWYSQWYPLDPLCDLDKRAPRARTVLGLDVVIWWDRMEGAWKVLDDRCPHRLAPLSEGRIDHRGRLQCSYHGWCFDGAGTCKYIPQAPALGPPVLSNFVFSLCS
jgi:phenylpropionate dioxygenase-like ring-hydroxylating dioxygenase large terminal subunit